MYEVISQMEYVWIEKLKNSSFYKLILDRRVSRGTIPWDVQHLLLVISQVQQTLPVVPATGWETVLRIVCLILRETLTFGMETFAFISFLIRFNTIFYRFWRVAYISHYYQISANEFIFWSNFCKP